MNRFLLFFAVLLWTPFLHSQKLIKKTILRPTTEFIQIDGTHCYQIGLKTAKGKTLEVRASIEGEYAGDLAIKLEEEGKSIRISADFLPNFKFPNDKLSAHKVISIALEILVPEYSDVRFYGTNTHVFAQGDYRNLTINLANGNCSLRDISENISVKTQKGGIIVLGAKGRVDAESHYGKVFRGAVPAGDQRYTLYSIQGDIRINKTNG